MDNSERTVIIAGGSVAGLSLANMLEKRGIRYVVLEAYDEIAPQVGASIGLHPSALRILDQLGCAEDLLSLIDIPLNESNVRNADGSIIRRYEGYHDNFTKRHGYPIIFVDRQMLLKALYNNLESKSSILPGNRVESVTELDQGVEVRTTKGEVYRGDILVGADGIYSTVRKEMWRIGNETSPGYFHPDEWSKVPCSYKCIFGISHPIKTLPSGVHYVYNRNFSYLVIVGPGGRVYWFLFVELPTPLFGRQIPRYTKSDEERLAKEHASDQITPNTRFGQLYEAKMNSTLTPLHEYAFEKWYFNRIITIGDAAHKFEPLTGHGGNSAIGTAASLMNHLFPDECPKWNDAHISAAFKAVQDDRFDRVSWLIKDAHETQRMQAMATPIQAVLTPILPYFISNETTLRLAASKFVGANHLNNIPLPQRDHTVPFNDELPAQPLSSFKWASAGLGVLSQGCLCWLSGRALRHSPVPTTFGSASLIKKWTGIQGIDSVLSVLVAAFGVPLTSPKEAPLVQWLSFIPLVFSTTLDWTVQSYRAGSAGLLTSWPSIYGAVFQLIGIGRVAPIYHLISALEHSLTGSPRAVTSHRISKEVAVSLPLGLGVGYVLPSILMVWPFDNQYLRQKITALWQPFPVFVGAITLGISTVLRRHKSATSATRAETKHEKGKELEQHKHTDQSVLRLIYTTGAVAAALVHLWSLYRISSRPGLDFSGVFGKLGALVSRPSETNLEDVIFGFFQRDMFFNAVSVLAHNIYRTVDLRQSGYVTTREAVSACLVTLVAQPVLGPAAVHIGFLGWREEVLTRMNRRIWRRN